MIWKFLTLMLAYELLITFLQASKFEKNMFVNFYFLSWLSFLHQRKLTKKI